MTKKYILIPNYEKMIFFINLTKKLDFKNLVLITNDVFVYFYIKVFYSKYKVIQISNKLQYKKLNKISLSSKEKKILNWEIKVYSFDPLCVHNKYNNLKNWFMDNLEANAIGICWSGNDTFSLAFSLAIKKKYGKVFYCEITNFPLSIYIDSDGVNYYSSVRTQYILSAQTIEYDDSYKIKLKNIKANMKILPQAKTNIIKNIDNIIIKLSSYLHPCTKIINHTHDVNLNKINIKDFNSQKYRILIPMQVANDTQLHIFSSFSSPMEYIRFIIERIDSSIFVDFKLHPAENKKYNTYLTSNINQLSKKFKNIKLVESVNISQYDAILTVNSTFGIDALLNDTRVITFGQSLYSGFAFTWAYDFNSDFSIRFILEQYDSKIQKKSFNLFTKILMDNFYNLNYFSSSLNENISNDLLEDSLLKLKSRLH